MFHTPAITHIPRWVTTAVVSAAILYATLAPHPVGADQLPLIPGLDKVIHFIMFATFTASMLFDLGRTNKAAPAGRRMALAGAVSVVFGAVDELLQSYITENRSGDIIDWFADMAGIVTVLLIFAAWRHRHRHATHRPACRD